MKKEDVKVKKLNNKGFSLVEIIIVIAIMAILAGALAPQLMKYIEKSRIATDINNCSVIKTAAQTALTNEIIYDEVTASRSIDIINGAKPSGAPEKFINEVEDIIGTWPKAKEKGKSGFQIYFDGNKNVTVQVIPTPTLTPTAIPNP